MKRSPAARSPSSPTKSVMLVRAIQPVTNPDNARRYLNWREREFSGVIFFLESNLQFDAVILGQFPSSIENSIRYKFRLDHRFIVTIICTTSADSQQNFIAYSNVYRKWRKLFDGVTNLPGVLSQVDFDSDFDLSFLVVSGFEKTPNLGKIFPFSSKSRLERAIFFLQGIFYSHEGRYAVCMTCKGQEQVWKSLL